MNRTKPDTPLMGDVSAPLERAFIQEYLKSQGYSLEMLDELSKKLRKKLMTEASRYASLKLEEIAARAHFVDEIHDGGSSRE